MGLQGNRHPYRDLENHWRGEISDSVEKALGLARSMTYRRIKPTVRNVTRTYCKGVPDYPDV